METYRKIAATRFHRAPDAQEAKPLIGKEEYKIISNFSFVINNSLLEFRRLFDEKTARSIAFQLHNNSTGSYASKRPASAYFTELDDKLIIEWGEIDAQGDAKLHHYLNRSVDYVQRVREGGVVRSGHIGHINFPGAGKLRVALLDSLWSENPISPLNPEYNMVTTLLHNGILPITSDGYIPQVSID